MRNLVTAFFMAWGYFLRIPCPVKKWDESLRKTMLAMLPLIGLIVGLIWIALASLINLAGIPAILGAFILTLYIYGVCGFLHLDGFMDCSDAIMSRRSLEEKQRILKDSHVGAFAVISAIFLILGMFSCLYLVLSMAAEESAAQATLPSREQVPMWTYLISLIIVPIATRAVSGKCVLQYKPMATSQYAKEAPKTEEKESKKEDLPIKAITMMALVADVLAIGIVLAALFTADNADIEALRPGDWVTFPGHHGRNVLLLAAVSYVFAVFGTQITASLSKKSLGGMNGDIAGHSICVGELLGLLAFAICTMFVR